MTNNPRKITGDRVFVKGIPAVFLAESVMTTDTVMVIGMDGDPEVCHPDEVTLIPKDNEAYVALANIATDVMNSKYDTLGMYF